MARTRLRNRRHSTVKVPNDVFQRACKLVESGQFKWYIEAVNHVCFSLGRPRLI